MTEQAKEERKVPPGYCRRPDGLIIEEEFRDQPRRLCAYPSVPVVPIMLQRLLNPVVFNIKTFSFTVSFWIGALRYHSGQELVMTFEKYEFCRHDKNTDIYELQMSFVRRQFSEVAEWLMVEGDVINLYGYLSSTDNRISLFTDRKYAASVLDYGKEKTE